MNASVIRWRFQDYWATKARTATFYWTGGAQTFQVPDGVNLVEVHGRGAHGGGRIADGIYLGGYAKGYLTVTPNENLQVNVGGNGETASDRYGARGGWNGGGRGGDAATSSRTGGHGGGGAVDLRRGGTDLAHRAFIIGAGAGNGGTVRRGGAGGPRGNTGYSPLGAGGQGATEDGAGYGPYDAQNGALGIGGRAGSATQVSADQNPNGIDGAGGGGAGKYGGGGGASGAGGGGGSNDLGLALDSKPTANEYGVLAQAKSQLLQPYLRLVWYQEADDYVFDINPNDGGSPAVTKNLAVTQSTGPNRVNILQEGQSAAPVLDFSGTILTQQHYEALETWFDKRIFLKLTDDLNREFYGVFSRWTPRRTRRPNNVWFHTFDAEFTCSAYRNASGNWIYGRVT